jgi:hypothetical protein
MRWRDCWKSKVKSKKEREVRRNYAEDSQRHQSFEFALRIIKLGQHLDRKPVFRERSAINS